MAMKRSIRSREGGYLIAIIGDEDTATGFLLAGVGDNQPSSGPNYFVVDPSTLYKHRLPFAVLAKHYCWDIALFFIFYIAFTVFSNSRIKSVWLSLGLHVRRGDPSTSDRRSIQEIYRTGRRRYYPY